MDNVTAEQFNKRHLVGAIMRYTPLLDEPDVFIVGPTESSAWTLGCGEAVVKIEGRAGCVSIEHLTACDAEEKT